MTEHPVEDATSVAGSAPIDVEDLHKLVLQSLDDELPVLGPGDV